MRNFSENRAGVHLMNPIQAEYSLCGDAYDIDSEPDDEHDGALKETKSRTVTCERCKAIIINCRGVRTA
jgi:hypothetical protein